MRPIVDKELRELLQNKLKKTFKQSIDNPVLKAQITWEILSEQLQAVLGDEIHTQWFKNIRPIVLKDNILILQTQTHFAAQWISTHYHQLADTLLLTQDKNYSCFFIAPKKLDNMSDSKNLPESA